MFKQDQGIIATSTIIDDIQQHNLKTILFNLNRLSVLVNRYQYTTLITQRTESNGGEDGIATCALHPERGREKKVSKWLENVLGRL